MLLLNQTCWHKLVILLLSTMTELEAFMERFKHKKYSARLAPRFWSLEGPQADILWFNVQQDCVILLDQLVGRYGDFTAGFKIGAITDHFMINLLCEVLMDMHHSSLDTINETWLLEWDNVVRARDDTTRLWLGCSSWHLLFSVRAKAKLEALEVADLKKLLGCVYVWSTGWVCYHVRVLQSLKMFLLFIKILSYLG